MKHGHCAPSLGNQTNSPTYKSWQQMNQRCHNPNHKFYPDYGGRGITVCKRWRASFEAFLEDMGERPEGLELDRIDNNRGYKPSNCKWSTRTQQLQNTRRTTWITIYGEKRSVHEWATLFGVHAELIVKRLKAGWPPDEAITVPSGQSRN